MPMLLGHRPPPSEYEGNRVSKQLEYFHPDVTILNDHQSRAALDPVLSDQNLYPFLPFYKFPILLQQIIFLYSR